MSRDAIEKLQPCVHQTTVVTNVTTRCLIWTKYFFQSIIKSSTRHLVVNQVSKTGKSTIIPVQPRTSTLKGGSPSSPSYPRPENSTRLNIISYLPSRECSDDRREIVIEKMLVQNSDLDHKNRTLNETSYRDTLACQGRNKYFENLRN